MAQASSSTLNTAVYRAELARAEYDAAFHRRQGNIGRAVRAESDAAIYRAAIAAAEGRS